LQSLLCDGKVVSDLALKWHPDVSVGVQLQIGWANLAFAVTNKRDFILNSFFNNNSNDYANPGGYSKTNKPHYYFLYLLEFFFKFFVYFSNFYLYFLGNFNKICVVSLYFDSMIYK
jgi:hypothetical protein